MLQLYDLNHNKIGGLTNYKDFKIQREINQLDILSFLYPVIDAKHDLIQEECYIKTKDNEYVVKEVNYSDENYDEYICKVNIEDISGKDVSHFEAIEQICTDSVNLALAGTGWSIGSCDVTKKRTARKNNCTAHDVLKEIQSAFACEIAFDAINKKVYIYQQMGSDKGTYFTEQLNLKKVNPQRNSYDYITRLIAIGKDGLDITSVNGGKNYVENYQYSNKVLAGFWEDNRYTVAQDLYDDAVERLDFLSKPYKAYSADVYDLANMSENNKYSILDYSLGDTITLISRTRNIKEKQRIVKLTEYPDEPEKNTVEIANKIASLDVLNVRFQDTSDTVDSVTTSAGEVDGTKVNGIDWTQVKNVSIYCADIQDLSTVTGRIGTLETTTAHITNGVIDNATIDIANVSRLSSTYATINNLDAAVGRIGTLETNTGTIINLLSDNAGIGSLSSQSIMANYAALANATLGDTQITNLTAAAIKSGSIDTSKVSIQGTNGQLNIADNTIQIKDTNRVRVQIGKDASNDYNMYVWDASGNLMFDALGLKASGIKDKIIRDDMVSDTANINGSKIEKESLVAQINGATTTLKASKIYLDTQAQTLDLAFTVLSTTVSNQGTTLNSQSTSISMLQGQITTKVSQTDIQTMQNGICAVDNTNANIIYSGTWITNNNAGDYNSTALYSYNTNDYFQYTFVGTGVNLYFTQSNNRGIAHIYIDSIDKGTIDCYNSSVVYKWLGYSITNLIYGTHTVKVVVTGTKNSSSTGYIIDFDYMKILNSVSLSSIQNQANAVQSNNAVNLVSNGNFSNGTTGWNQVAITGTIVSNNVCTFTPTAQWGGIQQPFSGVSVGDILYIRGDMQTTDTGAYFYCYGVQTPYHSSTNQYETLSKRDIVPSSNYHPWGSNSTVTASNFASISVKNILMVNLSKVFGAGNEPSQAWCDTNLTYDKIANNLQTQITNNTTSITQLNNAISLKANATSLSDTNTNLGTTNTNLSNLTTRVSAAELKITPDAILSTVSASTISSSQALTTVDDSDGSITYSGTWSTNNISYYYNSTSHISNVTNSYAQYTFIGTGINIYTYKGTTGGIVEVFIDGVSKGTIDTYNPSETFKQKIYSITDLTYGTHTIKINVTGTKNSSSSDYYLAFDYLEILNSQAVNASNFGSIMKQNSDAFLWSFNNVDTASMKFDEQGLHVYKGSIDSIAINGGTITGTNIIGTTINGGNISGVTITGSTVTANDTLNVDGSTGWAKVEFTSFWDMHGSIYANDQRGLNFEGDGSALFNLPIAPSRGFSTSYYWSGTVPASGSVTITHSLGHYPVFTTDGTLGNIMLTFSFPTINQLKINNFTGNPWNGAVRMY